jgi:2-polyprenyl-6-hydroxyphenyl methylase/3-demethylubiquinone-9 3-methyltransferase
LLSLHDDIWSSLPAERALDDDVLEFALDVYARAGASIRILDLGCGDGRVAGKLARAGALATGVDPSPVALERAHAAHPALDLHGPLPDGRLPLADCSFELVLCIHVLEHVADTQLLLSEARRVLVPGGVLAVAVPWHGRLKNVLISLSSFERHHDPLEPVLRFYTPRSLRALLDALGFERIELETSGGLPLARTTLLARCRRGSP